MEVVHFYMCIQGHRGNDQESMEAIASVASIVSDLQKCMSNKKKNLISAFKSQKASEKEKKLIMLQNAYTCIRALTF